MPKPQATITIGDITDTLKGWSKRTGAKYSAILDRRARKLKGVREYTWEEVVFLVEPEPRSNSTGQIWAAPDEINQAMLNFNKTRLRA